jgi:hypothetical protein
MCSTCSVSFNRTRYFWDASSKLRRDLCQWILAAGRRGRMYSRRRRSRLRLVGGVMILHVVITEQSGQESFLLPGKTTQQVYLLSVCWNSGDIHNTRRNSEPKFTIFLEIDQTASGMTVCHC